MVWNQIYEAQSKGFCWKMKRKRLILSIITLLNTATVLDACSSRSTPKPQELQPPVLRPNITIQTFTCPTEYDQYYCLNGANCFTIKIGSNILYNCECSDGYMGQRCEFKDLDGSYMPSRHRELLEQAGITSTVVILILFIVFLIIYFTTNARSSYTVIHTYPSSKSQYSSYQSIGETI